MKEKCVVNSSNFKLTLHILITGDNLKNFPPKNLLTTVNQNKKYGRTILKIFCWHFNIIFKDNGILFYHLGSNVVCRSGLRLHNENMCLSQSQNELPHFCFIFMFICHYFPSALSHVVPHRYPLHFSVFTCVLF